MKTLRRAAGFTLVELMITIAILAIISAFAVPSFNDMIQRNNRVSCTNEIIGALQLARSEAVRLGRNITVDAVGNDDISTGVVITDPDNTVLQQTAACGTSAVTLANGVLPFDYRGDGQTDLPVAGAGLSIDVCYSGGGADGRSISLLSTGVLRYTRKDDCGS